MIEDMHANAATDGITVGVPIRERCRDDTERAVVKAVMQWSSRTGDSLLLYTSGGYINDGFGSKMPRVRGAINFLQVDLSPQWRRESEKATRQAIQDALWIQKEERGGSPSWDS